MATVSLNHPLEKVKNVVCIREVSDECQRLLSHKCPHYPLYSRPFFHIVTVRPIQYCMWFYALYTWYMYMVVSSAGRTPGMKDQTDQMWIQTRAPWIVYSYESSTNWARQSVTESDQKAKLVELLTVVSEGRSSNLGLLMSLFFSSRYIWCWDQSWKLTCLLLPGELEHGCSSKGEDHLRWE